MHDKAMCGSPGGRLLVELLPKRRPGSLADRIERAEARKPASPARVNLFALAASR